MNIPEGKKQHERRQSGKHRARFKEQMFLEVGSNRESKLEAHYSHRWKGHCQTEEFGNREPLKALEEGNDVIGAHDRIDG